MTSKRAIKFLILTAFALTGCHRDPIARLVHQVSYEDVASYPFNAIQLPPTATPEQLITALSKRSVLDLGRFDFHTYKISEIRPVQTEGPLVMRYTAVLLDTELGQKIVLLRPMQSGTNWYGWYYRTYDAK